MNTEKKIVLITGSESGIGQSAAIRMLNYGYVVIGADIRKNPDFMNDNPDYVFFRTDLTDHKQITGLFDFVKKEYGRIDILLNCAGITSLDGINDITPEKWDKMFDINLRAVFFCWPKCLKYYEKTEIRQNCKYFFQCRRKRRGKQ